jgi:hypothetical protein
MLGRLALKESNSELARSFSVCERIIVAKSMSEMASLEKSRNSPQTGGWRRASFHASL